MNLNFSIDQTNDLIRKNEKRKRYFLKKISPRFSDCVYERKIHFSKIFEFFEMARFDIMHSFYDFYQQKKQFNENVNLGSFVVVRVQCENYEMLNTPIYGDITIKTALIVHQKPLLEFDQTAFENENNQPLIKANIKIAIVDTYFNKVENWDSDVLLVMLEFINTYGKEELI
jgi:acyl-CoA thioesterase FadM